VLTRDRFSPCHRRSTAAVARLDLFPHLCLGFTAPWGARRRSSWCCSCPAGDRTDSGDGTRAASGATEAAEFGADPRGFSLLLDPRTVGAGRMPRDCGMGFQKTCDYLSTNPAGLVRERGLMGVFNHFFDTNNQRRRSLIPLLPPHYRLMRAQLYPDNTTLRTLEVRPWLQGGFPLTPSWPLESHHTSRR